MKYFGIIVAALITVLALVSTTSYITANNYGARVEATLIKERDNNQNILAQYQQAVMEMVQVPAMYKDDLKEVISSEMSGRYGAEGSKANFQWIKEHALNFDSKLYVNIQEKIQAGRKDFERGQTRMLDVRSSYESSLGSFWRGMWLGIAGYPKINLADYKPVVTDRVEETFKAGKESAPLKLR
jgi:hypothetical protein